VFVTSPDGIRSADLPPAAAKALLALGWKPDAAPVGAGRPDVPRPRKPAKRVPSADKG
jgi:hypothetical protein